MTSKTFGALLWTTALGAVAALGLAAASPAQPYDEPTYDQGASDYTTGDIVVQAPRYRQERSFNGAPIVWARASRVVDYSDLDLSTRWGVNRLHRRVERAAFDACDELTHQEIAGLYPVDDPNNVDCVHRAVADAMAHAPITYIDDGD